MVGPHDIRHANRLTLQPNVTTSGHDNTGRQHIAITVRLARSTAAHRFALMISAPAVAVVAKTNPIAANPSGLSTASE